MERKYLKDFFFNIYCLKKAQRALQKHFQECKIERKKERAREREKVCCLMSKIASPKFPEMLEKRL